MDEKEDLRPEAEAGGKRPVLGSLASTFRFVFLALFVVCTAVFVIFAWKYADARKVLLIIMGICDVLFLLLSYLVPVSACCGNYFYQLSGEGISLLRRDEEIMSLNWSECDISLGSYIRKGSENNPSVCAPAICITRKGEMRSPQRFPKRALRGAAGEMCVAYSKKALREIYDACGGYVSGELNPDGCRLSTDSVAQMQAWLDKLRDKAAKAAAAQARAEEKAAAQQAKLEQMQARAEAKAQEKAAKAAAREEDSEEL